MLPCRPQVHETVPQALLPLEPLLRDEVMGELDVAKRRAAVDLVAKLLSRHPSGTAKILDEYEPLLEAFLGRTNDLEVKHTAGCRCWVLGAGRLVPFYR